jgi:predicted DNA-binding transcriptional regulator YafY
VTPPDIYTANLHRTETHVTFWYNNWKGKSSSRHVIPGRIFYGSTPYHPEPQWLMECWDLAKKETRTFSLKDISSWSPYKE